MTNQLPEGYSLADPTTIQPEEVMALRKSVDWGIEDEKVWIDCLNASITVGVRNANSELVGIGFITGSIRHGVLCDMCVHPNHQKRGIARFLIEERIRQADKAEIRFLYTALSDVNSLLSLYESNGFTAEAKMLFRSRQ